MRISLIPVLAALLCTASTLHAQVPEPVRYLKVDPSKVNTPEVCGNSAGSFVIGPKGTTSQTNDVNLPIIFLCANDSVFIDHNCDGAFAGDPDPSTPGGIGWAFYKCKPVIEGDRLIDDIVTKDTCLITNAGPPPTPIIARGDICGDIWFHNSGTQITNFGLGQPVSLWFAPMTLDIFNGPGGFGTFEGAGKPGPCVNVNIADAFEVVYLNPIIADNLQNNAQNDCLGSFIIKGGWPQYDKTKRYSINITKLNDPTVTAQIHTPIIRYSHGEPIVFSVPQPGQYLIEARDGKSCSLVDTVDMAACDPTDNLIIKLPTSTLEPGEKVCIPVIVNNFNNILSNSFTVSWDQTVLQYDTVSKPHPTLQFTAGNNMNSGFAGNGSLSFSFFRSTPLGSTMNVPNDKTLIEICFTVIGSVGDCTPFSIINSPALLDATKSGSTPGSTLPVAITPINGSFCIEYDPLVLKDTIVDPLCDQTASLQVTAEGGQEPFEVSYTPLLGGPVLTQAIAKRGVPIKIPGLTNGEWIVCLRDNMGLGQSICDTILVNVPTLGVNLDFTPPKCFGDKNGTAKANVQVNAVPVTDLTKFDFTWAGTGVVQGKADQTGLGAGNYSVTIKENSSGCTAVASGSLSQPAKISSQFVVVTDATCSGVDDGSITVITKGGTPFPGSEYKFTWQFSPSGLPPFVNEPKGSGQTNPSVLAMVASGTYKMNIEDANGCMFDSSIVVKNQFDVLIGLIKLEQPRCTGDANGSILVEVKSTPDLPNANWQFQWIPPGADSTVGPISKYKNASAGKYGVLVFEALRGCGDTATFNLVDPPVLALSVSKTTNPTCKGVTDGSIEVKATGGTPAAGGNYTYTWPAPLTPGPIKTGLSAGTYTVTVTDANNCSSTISATLALPTPPKITLIDSTSVKCGFDGSLEVRTSTPNVKFQWTDLTGKNLGNTAKINGLDGGQYVYIVTDANDCVSKDTVTLGAIQKLAIDNFTITNPKCFGDSTGRVVINVIGGQKNYSYNWLNVTPPQTSSVLLNRKAGSYIVVVKDAKGCELRDTFKIDNPPSISAGYTDFAPTTCVETCDGKFSVQVNMSDGSKPDFNFRWENEPTVTDSIRSNLCIGKYKVTVTNPNSCFVELEITMTGPDSIQVDTFITNPTTCNLGKDGSAEVKVTTGSGNGGPFKYAWNTVPVKVTPIITGQAAGAYVVTITDRKGCTKVFTKEIEQPLPIVLQLDNDNTSLPKCFAGEDGKIAVKVSGGNPGQFKFAWTDDAGNPMGTDVNPLGPVAAGKYNVTATDIKGCTGSISGLVLSDPPPVTGSLKPYEPLKCFGDETVIRIDQISGGNGAPYKFSVDNGAVLNPDFPVTLGGGEHIITFIDRNSCEFSQTITINEPPEVKVIFDPKVIEISLGDSTFLSPEITSGVLKTITWTPLLGLADPDSIATLAKPITSTRYKLSVEDQEGCMGMGEVTIIVDPNRDVYIPNIFMPGTQSELNFSFSVYTGLSVENVNFMQVYNRWGELMFERKNFTSNPGTFADGWDGRYRGDFVNPGVYVYVAEVLFKDGRTLLYRGDVTVIR